MLPMMEMMYTCHSGRPSPTPMGIAPRSSISGTIETKNTVRYLVSIINLVVVLLSINDNFLIIQDNDQFGKYYFKGSPQGELSLLPYGLTLFYIHILKFVLFCQIRPIL